MWVKNILKAFQRDIKLAYYINGNLMEEYSTVGKFMDSGLCNYVETQEQGLTIIDNAIVIKTCTDKGYR